MATLQRGRRPIESPLPEITNIREVARADLSHLTTKREPTVVATLRDSHHRIARAIASGLSNAEVAMVCGISANRASILRNDPAMQNLIAHKRSMIDAEWATASDPVVSYLDEIKIKSLAQIATKLDDAEAKGETLPSRDLATFAELGLDRTGYGKVNKNVNVNVDFAANLERARNRAEEARAARTIDGEASTVPASPRPEPEMATTAIAPRRPSPSLAPSLRRF